jgi:hypothetical protein
MNMRMKYNLNFEFVIRVLIINREMNYRLSLSRSLRDFLAIAVASNPDAPAEIRNDIIKTSFWFRGAFTTRYFIAK